MPQVGGVDLQVPYLKRPNRQTYLDSFPNGDDSVSNCEVATLYTVVLAAIYLEADCTCRLITPVG